MSFSFELKEKLCRVDADGCCRASECRAAFLSGGELTAESCFFSCRCPSVAGRIDRILRRDLGIIGRAVKKGGETVFTVPGEGDRIRLINMLSFDPAARRECCRGAYLRAAFLVCGGMNDPSKDYRVDFYPAAAGADELCSVMYKCGLNPKRRANGVYLRNSREIEDFLTIAEAGDTSLELMGLKIYRDMANKSNRQRNCDGANIRKAVTASVKQTAAINRLIAANKLDALSPELKEAALLRIRNPGAPLSELCGLCSASVTRSGLSHRLRRIVEIAETLPDNARGE